MVVVIGYPVVTNTVDVPGSAVEVVVTVVVF